MNLGNHKTSLSTTVKFEKQTANQQFYDFDIRISVFLFLVLSSALINSFYIDKHLSADGVHKFVKILDLSGFRHEGWSRYFSDYLTQWPLVAAVRMGVKNILVLSKIYSLGMYSVYILSFALCIYAAGKENRPLLLFPLASIAGINLSSDYILAGEHNVMVLLSWPILIFSLKRDNLNWIDACLIWLILVLFSRTYETSIIPAIIFAVIFGFRGYYFRRDRKQLIINGIAFLLSILTFIISLYFILNPASVRNKAGFFSNIGIFFNNPEALTTAGFILLFTLGTVLKKKLFTLVSLFPLLIYIVTILSRTHGITAGVSFASRTLSLSLLPFLFVCSIVVWHYKSKASKISIVPFIIFILIITAGNIRFSQDWRGFHREIRNIVTEEKGFIPIEEVMPKRSPYGWAWNNSMLSIVWSQPCVKAILLNRPDENAQIFDPRKQLILKRYVKYDSFFAATDKNITVCE